MIRVYALVFLFTSFVTTTSAQPIALNRDNPHYFTFHNQPAVLITSGEHYGAVLNLDFDYKKYLDELYAHRLNMTRTFSGVYCEQPGAFNIHRNTLAPMSSKYITPWARSNTPGYKNGGNKFDLEKWDEKYFDRLKDFVKTAAMKNVVVEFTLFCPFYEDGMWLLSPMHPSNNINKTPDIPRTDVYTVDKNGPLLEIQKKLVRKLVSELNGFDNVIFEICNEPYFGGVTMEWQHAIADVIAETESGLSRKHLISQNIQNGSSAVTDPHPAVSVFNWHYAYPPTTVALNYSLNKVIGDNETGFRGNSDTTYRFEAWRFILAGGALFNHLDYSFAIGHESGDNKYDTATPGGGSAALRKQFSVLRKFIEGFDFVKMKPDSSLLNVDAGYNALAEPGRQYAVYFLGGLAAQIDISIPSGKYEVVWLHPGTGVYETPSTIDIKKNILRVNVPSYTDDIALKIIRKN